MTNRTGTRVRAGAQHFLVGERDPREIYAIMTASIIPRPIAWVSTRSRDGIDNLAPHSFFTVASVSPPILQFTSVSDKDSLRNVRETGEFVISVVTRDLMEAANTSGTPFPPEVSEFDAAGVERAESMSVRPPRVAASPIGFECKLHSIIGFGMSSVVLGTVTAVHLDESVLEDGLPATRKVNAAARLGRDEWSLIGELFDMHRVTG
jgi:flavin reductase (DIM6/NTAB) family NADH-FMN oxidoreductase RutF